jgi:predicted SnoaL-like aldol condensation-catalyzing enzyme
MPTVDQIRAWGEAYRVAWETVDSAAAAALFTDDASYRSNIYEEPHRGRTGIADYWTEVTSTQSSVTVRMGEPIVDGERVGVEFWTTMTVDSAPVTLAGCLLLRFDEDGLCADLREYWNFTDGTQQAPAGWGQ